MKKWWGKKEKSSRNGERKKDGDSEKSAVSASYSSFPGDPSTCSKLISKPEGAEKGWWGEKMATLGKEKSWCRKASVPCLIPAVACSWWCWEKYSSKLWHFISVENWKRACYNSSLLVTQTLFDRVPALSFNGGTTVAVIGHEKWCCVSTC